MRSWISKEGNPHAKHEDRKEFSSPTFCLGPAYWTRAPLMTDWVLWVVSLERKRPALAGWWQHLLKERPSTKGLWIRDEASPVRPVVKFSRSCIGEQRSQNPEPKSELHVGYSCSWFCTCLSYPWHRLHKMRMRMILKINKTQWRICQWSLRGSLKKTSGL